MPRKGAMRWYYWGMGFNSAAARKKAIQLGKKENCKIKITKSKDPLGGYMYKLWTSKSI